MGWTRCFIVVSATLVVTAFAVPPAPEPHFSLEERAEVRRLWQLPGRYEVSLPDAATKTGPFQVRQTVEGSVWLWTHYRKADQARLVPTFDQQRTGTVWDAWIKARQARDVFEAAELAASMNASLGFTSPKPSPAPEVGPIPDDLLELSGNPPKFAEPVAVKKHTIRFPTGKVIVYEDAPQMRTLYPYYRSHEGVMSAGVRMKEVAESRRLKLFREAGIENKVLKVMQAVSALEGGFDSVNTYDTGYVSVGFLQFACLAGGSGSLGQVMARMKADSPKEFSRDFRKYGLDVAPDGALVALDIDTGAELIGPDAAQKIIQDKRLISVFQHAGLTSDAFCVAQLKVAKESYYPEDDLISVKVGDKVLSGRVGDIFKTEAGLATLMDRKINRGKLDPLLDVLTEVCRDYDFTSLPELSAAEYELIRKLVYRKDYLADDSLSRPRDLGTLASRKAKRGGRTPPKAAKR